MGKTNKVQLGQLGRSWANILHPFWLENAARQAKKEIETTTDSRQSSGAEEGK